jgi:hypothetical protein
MQRAAKRNFVAVLGMALLLSVATILVTREAYQYALAYVADQPGDTDSVRTLFAYAPSAWSMEVLESALQGRDDWGVHYKLLNGAQELQADTLVEIRPKIYKALRADAWPVRIAALDLFIHHPSLANQRVFERVREMAQDPDEDEIVRFDAQVFLRRMNPRSSATTSQTGH